MHGEKEEISRFREVIENMDLFNLFTFRELITDAITKKFYTTPLDALRDAVAEFDRLSDPTGKPIQVGDVENLSNLFKYVIREFEKEEKDKAK